MNTSRPPPQGPPSYAFATRIYKRNLRPIIITIAILTAIWALFSAIGNFRSAGFAKGNVPKLAAVINALGAIHAGICGFEAFGVFAAITQRLALVRIYAYLSIVTALAIVAAGLTRVVVHFTLKNDIITQCTALSENQTGLVYPFGYFGPVYRDFIDHDDAVSWCNRIWSRDSASEIISLLIAIIVAALFTSLAFAYYRQVLDPSSPANFSRTPASANFGTPSHYNPAYNASVPNLGYGYNMPYTGGPNGFQGGFAPPAGPPPQQQRDDLNKPPGYIGGDGTAGAVYGKDRDDPFADFEDTSKRNADK